jgi:hypothetical protein
VLRSERREVALLKQKLAFTRPSRHSTRAISPK